AGCGHLLQDHKCGPKVGARRSTAAPPEKLRHDAGSGNARGIRYRNRPVNQFRNEGRLDLRAAYALDHRAPVWPDPDARIGHMPVIDGLEGISEAKHRRQSAVADITPNRRRGAAGAGTANEPCRDTMLFCSHLRENRVRDVVATPIDRTLRKSELIEIAAPGFIGD